MRERDGVNKLSAELRSVFHRIIAGVRISHPELINGICSKSPEYRINSEEISPETEIRSNSSCAEYRIDHGDVQNLDALKASGIAVEVRFESEPVCMEVIETSTVNSKDLNVELEKPKEIRLAVDPPKVVYKSPQGIKIANKKAIQNFPRPIQAGKPGRMKLLRGPEIIRDRDPVLDQPITFKACSWPSLERDFIVKCWEALKKKAVARLGRNPGKKLEMLGIYRNINVSAIRRSEFVQSTREYKLYLTRDRASWKYAPWNYVIIVGLDRETGAIIQAIIQDD